MKAHEEGTDEQLIERWNRQRDPAALNLLMGRYLPRFYLTARSMLMPVEEAEDIAQDVMLKVVVALDQYDARSTFQAWSYTILLNTVRSSVRRRNRSGFRIDASVPVDGVASRESAIDHRLNGAETNSLLHAAMQKLSEKQRVALVLMLMEGLSAAEVAQMEDCSVDAVYRRVSDGRRLLRSELSLKRAWLNRSIETEE